METGQEPAGSLQQRSGTSVTVVRAARDSHGTAAFHWLLSASRDNNNNSNYSLINKNLVANGWIMTFLQSLCWL